MIPAALAPYDRALRFRSPLALAAGDDRIDLDVARWLGPVDAVDETVLARCTAPVLDVGCGPGRFVAALVQRGVAALGIDIAETAVRLSRLRGAPALRRDVFASVPGEGCWPTVLLMDGNVGIGGDVPALLDRTRRLLTAHGRAIVEASPDDTCDDTRLVRFVEGGRPMGPRFRWARVGVPALIRYAGSAGLLPDESWDAGGRRFVVLRSATTRRT